MKKGEDPVWDVVVIGAGAAGLMTAISAKRHGVSRVLLLDGREKIGAKILMSGGTRCNITNQNVSERDYASENKRFVRNVLSAFPSDRAIEFFNGIGVETILEPGGKLFPSTHSGKTVLEALVRESERLGVECHTPRRVTELKSHKELFELRGEDFSYVSRSVVLCTGGLSFPATGSDGRGYELAKSFGHHLIPTSPSLVPLTSDDTDWKALSGISLFVRLTLWTGKKKIVSYDGSFLFTHVGFSGPVTLNISRHWIRHQAKGEPVTVTACFLPQVHEEPFRHFLANLTQQNPARLLKSVLSSEFPEHFVEIFLRKLGIKETVNLSQLSRKDREKLIRSLMYFPLRVNGALGYGKAEVTAGGIDLEEVDSKTMESKCQPGLFFAGEILDADGRIGGFNFQWSWSSGMAAGQGAAKRHV